MVAEKRLAYTSKGLNLCLDNVFVQTLITCFLGNLCHSDSYIKPTTMEIEEAALLQQLTLTQVFYTLSKIKMSVPGSQDQMASFLRLFCRMRNRSLVSEREFTRWVGRSILGL